jgi:sec-independent protein translocase protein TatB
MFDIGFAEILVIAVITLLVMGPERLPETVRTISLWIGRLRQAFNTARQEIEQEVGMDEVRHQLHNERILRDIEKSKAVLEESLSIAKSEQSAVIQELEKNPVDPVDTKND